MSVQLEQIVETKAQAEAIRVYTMQKQLGKDAELSAAEVVRRAERCIGLAIRKGQAEGRIRRRGQGRGDTHKLPSPEDFASHDERFGNHAGIYAMADGVPDDEFDAALTEAKSERNLSRANVVRKVKGEKAKDRWAPLGRLAAAGKTPVRARTRREGQHSTAGHSTRELLARCPSASRLVLRK